MLVTEATDGDARNRLVQVLSAAQPLNRPEKDALIKALTSEKLVPEDRALLVRLMGGGGHLNDSDRRRLVNVLSALEPQERALLLSALRDGTGMTAKERATLIQLLSKEHAGAGAEQQSHREILLAAFARDDTTSMADKVTLLRQIIAGSNLTDHARIAAIQLLGGTSSLSIIQKEVLLITLQISGEERQELLAALELGKGLSGSQKADILRRFGLSPDQFELIKQHKFKQASA